MSTLCYVEGLSLPLTQDQVVVAHSPLPEHRLGNHFANLVRGQYILLSSVGCVLSLSPLSDRPPGECYSAFKTQFMLFTFCLSKPSLLPEIVCFGTTP